MVLIYGSMKQELSTKATGMRAQESFFYLKIFGYHMIPDKVQLYE